MTGPSVKIPTVWLQSDELEDLGADTVLLMLTALAYCAEQTDDGWVPRRRLRKLWPVDDLEQAIEQLAKAGELEDHGERVLFTRWRDFILSQDEVEQLRAGSRERTERSRRHRRGDHTLCRPDYCNAARSRHMSRDGDATVRVSDALPIRSDPTRPLGRAGEGGGAAAGSAGAPPTTGPGSAPLVPHDHVMPRGVDEELDFWVTPCAICGRHAGDVVHLTCEWQPDPDHPDMCLNCSERPTYGGHAAFETYRAARDAGQPWRPDAA